jgi:hypothetical protein
MTRRLTVIAIQIAIPTRMVVLSSSGDMGRITYEKVACSFSALEGEMGITLTLAQELWLSARLRPHSGFSVRPLELDWRSQLDTSQRFRPEGAGVLDR